VRRGTDCRNHPESWKMQILFDLLGRAKTSVEVFTQKRESKSDGSAK
jgi:hypothetical protein